MVVYATKSHHNGSSRIASRIGGGFNRHNDLNNYSPALDHVQLQNGNDYTNKAQQLRNVWSRNASCAGLDQNLEYAYSFEFSYQFTNPQPDGERYFYHSDHLGSSAYITTEMHSIREDLWEITWTEQNGYATQFLAYMPFGETLSEQQNSTSYYSPFKFSAKEKDIETGYSYFGARYYSPELSVWLSVDPMSDKYPSLSPYNYCALNPIMLVDPDGREVSPPKSIFDFVSNFIQKKIPNFIKGNNIDNEVLSFMKFLRMDISSSGSVHSKEVVDYDALDESKAMVRKMTQHHDYYFRDESSENPAVIICSDCELVKEVYIVNESNVKIEYDRNHGKVRYIMPQTGPRAGYIRIVVPASDQMSGGQRLAGVQLRFNVNKQAQLKRFMLINSQLGGLSVLR